MGEETIGRPTEAPAQIEAIIEQVRGSPVAMANVALTLLIPKGRVDQARDLCARALAMDPEDGELLAIVAEVESLSGGAWYFSMVRDERRHAAYARAMGRALRSGGRVLDIGAGTGLFAMMAAKAGADEVVACERDPAVAAAARDIVAANGLTDRVKILAKASTDLAVEDIGGLADVLIWDNLANNLIGAGALPVLEDARRRLAKPGATVIPFRASVKVALAEDSKFLAHRMHMAEGFDLSAFNRLAHPVYTVSCDATNLSMRSDAATLFTFDFRSGAFPPARASTSVKCTGGPVNGLVQWLDFELDDWERYETAPGQDIQAFGLEFRPLAAPFESRPGEAGAIGGSHDRQRLRIWLDRA